MRKNLIAALVLVPAIFINAYALNPKDRDLMKGSFSHSKSELPMGPFEHIQEVPPPAANDVHYQDFRITNTLRIHALGETPGLTVRPVTYEYFIKDAKAHCHMNTLEADVMSPPPKADDFSGPNAGCKEKIDVIKVSVEPLSFYLPTEIGGVKVYEDKIVDGLAKYDNHSILISPDKDPVFDPKTGAVVTPGTLKVTISPIIPPTKIKQ